MSSFWLEDQFDTELNPTAAQLHISLIVKAGTRDSGIVNESVRQATLAGNPITRIWVIERVEKLHPQLQLDVLSDLRGFEETDVQVV